MDITDMCIHFSR